MLLEELTLEVGNDEHNEPERAMWLQASATGYQFMTHALLTIPDLSKVLFEGMFSRKILLEGFLWGDHVNPPANAKEERARRSQLDQALKKNRDENVKRLEKWSHKAAISRYGRKLRKSPIEAYSLFSYHPSFNSMLSKSREAARRCLVPRLV